MPLPTGPVYTPSVSVNGLGGGALGFAWPPLQVQDSVDVGTYKAWMAAAKFYGVQSQNEILGSQAMSVADIEKQIAYTCAAGLAVGDPVYISANNTVAKADSTNTTKNQVIGFVRFKGTLGATSQPAATTCYIKNFLVSATLSGGTFAAPIYLTDAGGFSATPGTISTPIGYFTSATTGELYAAPSGASGGGAGSENPGLFPEVDFKTLASTTLTLPLSQKMNPQIAYFRMTTLGGTLTGQPLISLGTPGNHNLYINNQALTLPAVVGNCQTWLALLVSDGTTQLVLTVNTAATGSSTIKVTTLVTGACF